MRRILRRTMYWSAIQIIYRILGVPEADITSLSHHSEVRMNTSGNAAESSEQYWHPFLLWGYPSMYWHYVGAWQSTWVHWLIRRSRILAKTWSARWYLTKYVFLNTHLETRHWLSDYSTRPAISTKRTSTTSSSSCWLLEMRPWPILSPWYTALLRHLSNVWLMKLVRVSWHCYNIHRNSKSSRTIRASLERWSRNASATTPRLRWTAGAQRWRIRSLLVR